MSRRKAKGDRKMTRKRKEKKKKRESIGWLLIKYNGDIWETFASKFLSGSIACCCTYWLPLHRLGASTQFGWQDWQDHYVLKRLPPAPSHHHPPSCFITTKGNPKLLQQNCDSNVHCFHQTAAYLDTSGCCCQRQIMYYFFNLMDGC